MNISKIKEYINLREDLKQSGVIGLDIWENRVHVRKELIVNHPELKVKEREDEQYPYQISVVIDGITLHTVLSVVEFKEYPDLKEKIYMEEDVQLDGMGSEEIA